MFELDLELSRLSVYAHSLSDEDVRAARPREMKQAAEELATAFSAATSWVRPEILTLDPAKVRSWITQEPKLAPYRMYLEETLRRKPHTLGAPEEKIAAEAGEMERAGGEVHGVLSNADLPYPTIKLSTGESVRLDASAFTLHRQARVRADRDKVFASFFGALKTYERTMGATLAAAVKAHLFEKRVRHFDTALAAALFQDNIPHRRLQAAARRRAPEPADAASLPGAAQADAGPGRPSATRTCTCRWSRASTCASSPTRRATITLDALAPLGQGVPRGAAARGSTAAGPTTCRRPGKRSGAYSTGVYGVHPYQLLNFNGRYEDLTTLAHESGHSMHTFLSHAAQPYPTADYPIFVAEVASTFNENLLIHFMLDRAKDDADPAVPAGHAAGRAADDAVPADPVRRVRAGDSRAGRARRAADRREPVEAVSQDRARLLRPRQEASARSTICWPSSGPTSRTSITTSTSTSTPPAWSPRRRWRGRCGRRSTTGKTARRDAYLKMLSSGSSKYAIDLLKDAGVDMTTSAPFDAAIAEMNGTMDEMEKILARQPKPARPEALTLEIPSPAKLQSPRPAKLQSPRPAKRGEG